MKIRYFALISVLMIANAAISAQTLTAGSYLRARSVLDKAIAAYGGLEKMRSIENFSITVAGDTVHRFQSRRPDTFDRTPYAGEVVVDLKNSRTMQTQKGHYPGGFDWYQGQIIDAGTRTSYDLIRKTSNPPGPIMPAGFRVTTRWLPQIMLLDANEFAERLRHLGKATYEGRAYDVIGYFSNDGGSFSLYIDERTGILAKFETFITARLSGDAVLETRFPGQAEKNGHIIPAGRVNVVNGDVTNDFRYTGVSINIELKDETFKLPQDLRAVTFPTPEPVTKHSANVYTTSAGGYNVLFVEMRDHIFVMEAPGNDRVSRQAIEQIKKTIPGKPIRYLAVSHHHDDHAGGIRTYMAEGATLIIAPGEQAFFKRMSTSPFTAEPDSLALNPRVPVFEPLKDGKRVFTDGVTTIEIYDIGPSPHAEQMLVAYLPNEKFIFQGDLLNRPPNGDYPIANDTSVHFLDWIDLKKLEVDKIIPVHGTVTTLDEFRKAVADFQAIGK